jgi:cytochrome b6-f complex iron-sulfur subunit
MSWVGVGWVAASLPLAIAACAPTSEQATTPEPDSPEPEPAAETPTEAPTESPTVDAEGFLAAGTTAELEAQGSLKVKEPQKLIVIQDPSDTTQVLALTSVCNHRNCTVDWKADAGEFLCPCHGSSFALDGALTNGPATEGLTALETKVDGETILVKVG